ncbi:endonuclease [Mesorhizobium sp. SB112]|uniref:endonuclease III domain-containing protein n=1 Tax=Mesorhizobium sp. SB112 TaxID=3151853 RepID=UPI0032666B93
MQEIFDFGARADITLLRDTLRPVSPQREIFRRAPIGQLVKSMISSRTKDADSLAAYENLTRKYPTWIDLLLAEPEEIEATIAIVSYADRKAGQVKQTLNQIHEGHPDFDLTFLGHMTVDQALDWLERLPGVGRKVAASTLNFSTLNMPAFVVDTHVMRVLQRFGIAPMNADIERTYTCVMAATVGWSPFELVELHVVTKLLGQAVCHFRRPDCRVCPLADHCQYAFHHRDDSLPSI